MAVGQSVPTEAAYSGSGRPGQLAEVKLYSTFPARSSSSEYPTPKSSLKSLPNDEAHGKVHPIRRRYACSLASGARDTAHSITSWLARCTAKPLKPSAIAEQDEQPALQSGPNMK